VGPDDLNLPVCDKHNKLMNKQQVAAPPEWRVSELSIVQD